MDFGTALSVAQTLFAALQCTQLKEALSILGYTTELEDLKGTVESINDVIRDAEAKQELPQQDENLIKKLKDAVFEADDLFDEFVTVAEQNKLRRDDSTFSKKVSNFFSPSKNKFSLAYKMSNGVKKIRKKLDDIANDKRFHLKIDIASIRERDETCSKVDDDIIGREDDLNKVVRILLAPNDRSDVSVLSIVGVGGSGKTALAQLAFNYPRVEDSFPLRLWVCVSDQGQKEFNVRSILTLILALITGGKPDHGFTLDQVQRELRKQLGGKKYLLVLDDVWTESGLDWGKLMQYLTGAEEGSCIVVTTRSQDTASITGGFTHNLSCLSEENSWSLFKRIAFAPEQPNPADNELVNIGRNIVGECSGNPLAIRVVGSFLKNQDKSVWLATQMIGLANKKRYNDDIMPILKFSFYQLTAHLKNCFRYCALFPKDYVIQKERLISLWMAQGYIVPLDNGQSIEDAGEEYFSILSKRCFFQNITRNKVGEIKSCKIHHLMHDLARNVSGKEMCAPGNIEGNVDDNVRHLTISEGSKYKSFLSLDKTHIRSFLSFECHHDFYHLWDLVKKFKCLRVLDLSNKQIYFLPNSIDKLLHLRYIDLSRNRRMKELNNSITKLFNLETLILSRCYRLEKLPNDFSRLVNLRVLDIKDCVELRWMPRGMGNLKRLHTLKGYYPVGGGGRSCTSWKRWLDGLEDLKSLINLKGHLKIKFWWPKNAKNYVKEDVREGLKSMEHLNHIKLCFKDLEEDSGTMEDEERIRRVMEDLQPHSKLKRLSVGKYNGVKMPGWLTATHLSQLVKLHLEDCRELKYLPCVGNLSRLKILCLEKLPKLEYIEEENRMVASTSSSNAQKASLFPSLEELCLIELPKFEGWRRVGVGMEESSNNSSSNQLHSQQQCLFQLEALEISSSNMKPQLQLCLSQLKALKIRKCPELTCILLCPMLETLDLIKFNERLQIICSTKTDERLSKAVSDEEDLISVPKLREILIDKVKWLETMPKEAFHTLEILTIDGDDDMVKLPDWMQYLSALQTLRIGLCDNLEAMPSWMPKLTSLKHLDLSTCRERLRERCREDPPGQDWPYIHRIPTITLGNIYDKIIPPLIMIVATYCVLKSIDPLAPVPNKYLFAYFRRMFPSKF